MPVATVPTYDEMWVNPQVVAALSNGVFVYTEVPEWAPDQAYARNDQVLYGPDAPYGGYVWSATANIPAGGDVPGDNPAWLLDQEATSDRLRLFTATTQATWLLDTLTGYHLHGMEAWEEDYQVHTCTIRLRRTPVIHVNSVFQIRRCNVPLEHQVPNWCQKSAQTISGVLRRLRLRRLRLRLRQQRRTGQLHHRLQPAARHGGARGVARR